MRPSVELKFVSLIAASQCDTPVPGIFSFLGVTRTCTRKIWMPKKVPVKFGTGKRPGIGINKSWYQ